MNENEDQHATAAPVTSESVDLEDDKKVWQMPEPVFRQSSGSLPQGFQKQFTGNENETREPDPVVASADSNGAGTASEAAPAGPPPPASEIQPQPDIIEDVLREPAAAQDATGTEKSRGMKLFLAVIGILAMVAFAVGFIALIYYLFFYHPGESNSVLN